MNIKSLTLPELTALLKELGQPAFRGKQVYTWLHKGVRSYEEMSNLPKTLRDLLGEKYPLHIPQVVRKQESQRDGTIKYLWELHDGNCVETVLMRYHYGNTVCISTEVGCRMGCRFCASTIGGKVRDLLPSELLGQIIAAERDSGERVSNVVMMGIGEPLDNFDNVEKFLRLVNHEQGINIGYRHISLSTCGVVTGIDRLARMDIPITLSISLHAATDEQRSEIMPVNKKWNIKELLDACVRYYRVTGRRISFEYTLISGKNDTLADARALGELLLGAFRGTGAPIHVNLIRVNEVEETGRQRRLPMRSVKWALSPRCAAGWARM